MSNRRWKRGLAWMLAVMTAMSIMPEVSPPVEVQAAETENIQEETKDSSDPEVLKELNFSLDDESYSTDDLWTGKRTVSPMEELAVDVAETGKSFTNIYDYDTSSTIALLNSFDSASKLKSYTNATDKNPVMVSTSFDGNGDGKKDYIARLYCKNGRSGGEIYLDVVDAKTNSVIMSGQNTGGYIVTGESIESWAVQGLINITSGDYDGDGIDELAAYVPNNYVEYWNSGSDCHSNELKINLYNIDLESGTLGSPYQSFDLADAQTTGEWMWSSAGATKQYWCIPYLSMSSGDANGDGIDELITVASFASTYRYWDNGQDSTWNQVLDPNRVFASVMDVYEGQKGSMKQTVKKRVLIGKDKNYGYVLRNASAIIGNVTGANTNEIVIGGNYTRIAYVSGTTSLNANVSSDRNVWLTGDDAAKNIVGFTSYDNLVADSSSAASLSYNWTPTEGGYQRLHYYWSDRMYEPVSLAAFAAYGSGQADTIALSGQLFEYGDEGGLTYNSYVPKENTGSKKSNVWIGSPVVLNATNDPVGKEILYYPYYEKVKGKEQYYSDIISVWGTVNAAAKGYNSVVMGDSTACAGVHTSLYALDIDDDSVQISYEAGNTDIYYSDVQVLSVLQAAPVYEELGDDYTSGAETSYGKSSGSSTGTGESHQITAGIVAGFEHETSLLGLTRVCSIEMEAELSASVGWESEKTSSKEFTTEYNTSGTTDVAVIYTVPYVRYNAKIFIPTYTLPTRAEYDAKLAFSKELIRNLEEYLDKKASITGGTYAAPNDGYNNGYTTNVTKDTYDYQVQIYRNYQEWVEDTESKMEGFEGSSGYSWGQEIEGGWEDYFYNIPQTPIITTVSVDTYDEVAAGCKNMTSLYGTALPKSYEAGDPTTYATGMTDLVNRTTADNESIVAGQTNAGSTADTGGYITSSAMSSSSSSPSQTIAFSEENAKTTSVGIGASLSVKLGVGDVTAGVSFSTDNSASKSTATTEGCEFSGQIPNLPDCPSYLSASEYGKYDYSWKLVAYDATVNGTKVPVVGYYTKYTNRNTVPSSTVKGLAMPSSTTDSVTLEWSAGGRAADHYNVYQVTTYNTGRKVYALKKTVSEVENGVFSCIIDNLESGTEYTYVVRSCNADESIISVCTDELTAKTMTDDFDLQVNITGLLSEETYLAGHEQTLEAGITTENYPKYEVLDYFWQVNDGGGWENVEGESKAVYTFTPYTRLSGNQYRCKAVVGVGTNLYTLYSDPVTLNVRRAQAVVTIEVAKIGAEGSDEFGPVSDAADTLKLTANVSAVQMQRAAAPDPSGNMVFVVTDKNNTENVKEYPAVVSKEGVATATCRFAEAGNYAIAAKYEGNEVYESALSMNTADYYAYGAEESFDLTADGSITVSEQQRDYTGAAIEPEPTVTWKNATLTKGTDYTVSYENNINAGIATVTVQGAGKFTGTKSTTFDISKANPVITTGETEYSVEMDVAPFNLNAQTTSGTALTYESSRPDIATVDAQGMVTVTGVSGATTVAITAAGSSNYEAGSILVSIAVGHTHRWTLVETIAPTLQAQGYDVMHCEGCGETSNQNYTEKLIDISTAVIQIEHADEISYTGEAIIPEYTVTIDDLALVKDVDYTAKCTNNVAVSKDAVLTITGIGKYGGELIYNYTIWKADPQLTTAAEAWNVKDTDTAGFSIGAQTSVADSVITYSGYDETLLRVSAAGEVTLTGKTGETTISVETAETPLYRAVLKNIPVTISCDHIYEYTKTVSPTVQTEGYDLYTCSKCGATKQENEVANLINILDATVTLEQSESYIYTGEAYEPTVTVTHNGTELVKGTDYTVSYENNKNAGDHAAVIVTGMGLYGNVKTMYFTITPVTPIITTTSDAYAWDTIPQEPIALGAEIEPSGMEITYTSSNEKVASVDADGNVTIHKLGSAVIVITPNLTEAQQGNYEQVTKEVTFRVGSKNDVALADITGMMEQIYTGEAITQPDIQVKMGDTALTEDTDYTLSYTDNVDTGDATLIITGKGAYQGTQEVSFRILPMNLQAMTIAGVQKELAYTGQAVKQTALTVSIGATVLKEMRDYTVSYENNSKLGEATAVITGVGNFTGSTQIDFEIVAADITKAQISGIVNKDYTGSEITQNLSVKLNGIVLRQNEDYEVEYEDNEEPGTAGVTITGIGNYKGTIERSFEILPVSLASATVSGITAKMNYTGKAITQSGLSISLNGKKLVLGEDYKVDYSNNTKLGTATITITGLDHYTGSIKKTFTIAVTKGKTYTVSGMKYKVVNASTTGSGTVALTGTTTSKSKLKSVTVNSTVTIGGKRFKIVEIGKNAFKGYNKITKVTIGSNVTKIGASAFSGCSKLKTLTIKSTKLSSVGSGAIKGISKKATIKCPSKKRTAYKKKFTSKTGYVKTMKIK